MHPILKKLQGGDRRSIGKVDEIVGFVLGSPALFDELINGLFVDDPVVRMRTADAVEKISRGKPDLLKPYKRSLIRLAGDTDQQEVRWHMAQILPRLVLNATDRKTVFDMLFTYLDLNSKIVVTFALQALADLAIQDPSLQPRVIQVLEKFTKTGSPAVKNRAKKLLERLNE